jgi:hypothetical protein
MKSLASLDRSTAWSRERHVLFAHLLGTGFIPQPAPTTTPVLPSVSARVSLSTNRHWS